MPPKPKRLFVVDAMAMAFRNYHAFGARPLTTAAGLPTSAVYGSAQFLWKLIAEERPDYLAIATDSKEPTFRHEMYPEYKANRKAMPEDLAAQLPHLFKLFEALRCPLLKQSGVEADDLIGTLVKRFGSPDIHCYIVSGDKDFMQTLTPHVSLYSPKKGGEVVTVTPAEVEARFQCQPEQVIDILALMGDSADNVPGVAGIGEKGAAKLVSEFGSVEAILENAASVKNKKQRESLLNDPEVALLSKKLVTIATDLPLSCSLEDLVCEPDTAVVNDDILALFEELEFTSLEKRVRDKRASLDAEGSSSAPSAAPEAAASASPAKETRYTLVDTAAKLDELCQVLDDAETFAVDTETTGLDIIGDIPIGLSFSTGEASAYYVPCHATHLAATELEADTVLERLRPLLKDRQKTKVGHNLKFDLHMLKNIGVSVSGPFVDTMLCSYLLEANQKGHGLDACCQKHLDYTKIPTSDLIGPKGETPMLDVPLDKLSAYACEDADFTLRLYDFFKGKVKAAGQEELARTIEMPLISVLADMEHTGTFVDTDVLAVISETLGARSAELEAEIHGLAGESFNINSTKKLQEILYDKLKIHEELGIKRLKKTKTGFSTDMSVMEKLSAHPLPRAILNYRTVTKLKNTYVDALPQLVHEKTNRVHTNFQQTGTATGRLSSSDPNLQNIPIRSPEGKEIRKAFRPAEKGWKIVSADYSQVELRILAHISKDEGLSEAFASGEDIHRSTASRIFGCKKEEVTDDQRSAAKAINFGIIYGMGANRLARETGVSFKEAKSFIEKYFQGYPRIRDYIDTSIESARTKGYTETITGRRRPLPEINSRDRMALAGAENIAVNSPIQGSAADLIKIAMINIDQSFRTQGLRAKMLIQVHDELVFSCPEDEVATVEHIVKEQMESSLDLSVPILVEIGHGDNWLEAH